MYRYGICLACGDYSSECACAEFAPEFELSEEVVFNRLLQAYQLTAIERWGKPALSEEERQALRNDIRRTREEVIRATTLAYENTST